MFDNRRSNFIFSIIFKNVKNEMQTVSNDTAIKNQFACKINLKDVFEFACIHRTYFFSQFSLQFAKEKKNTKIGRTVSVIIEFYCERHKVNIFVQITIWTDLVEINMKFGCVLPQKKLITLRSFAANKKCVRSKSLCRVKNVRK